MRRWPSKGGNRSRGWSILQLDRSQEPHAAQRDWEKHTTDSRASKRNRTLHTPWLLPYRTLFRHLSSRFTHTEKEYTCIIVNKLAWYIKAAIKITYRLIPQSEFIKVAVDYQYAVIGNQSKWYNRSYKKNLSPHTRWNQICRPGDFINIEIFLKIYLVTLGHFIHSFHIQWGTKAKGKFRCPRYMLV